MKIMIVRTSEKTIGQVVHHAKHALNSRPRLRRGDLILISQTKCSLSAFTKPIQYVMEYEYCYYDLDNESQRIWGKTWRYIIKGCNCRPMNNPFDISDVQITDKDYGRGGTIVYVEPDDIQVLKKKRLLD